MAGVKTARLATVLTLLAGAGLIIAACGSEQAESDSGLVAGTAEARGAEVYESSCASCHGADLRGTDEGPSHLSIVYEPGHHTDDSFRSAIANGAQQHHWTFGDMKPVEGLSETDIEDVIAFVRSEQQRQGFER